MVHPRSASPFFIGIIGNDGVPQGEPWRGMTRMVGSGRAGGGGRLRILEGD